MKIKVKEIAETQTQDLTTRIQLSVRNALAEETHQYQVYTEALITKLQENLTASSSNEL